MFVSKSGLTMVVKREGLMARVALLFKSEIVYSNKVIYISVISYNRSRVSLRIIWYPSQEH